jgi:hypothetical protein
MNALRARMWVLAGALTAMPLLETELLDWLKGVEGRTFFSEGIIIQLLTSLVTAIVTLIVNGVFGVV